MRRNICVFAHLSVVLLIVSCVPGVAKTLFSEDFSAGAHRWQPGAGNWAVEDGEYVQSDAGNFTTCFLKNEFWDYSWTEYTFELKAMKLGGGEGFDPVFGVARETEPPAVKADRDKATTHYYEWNLGGWGNTRSELRRRVAGANQGLVGTDHVVEEGVWHTIKIEVSPDRVVIFLDEEQALEHNEGPQEGRIGLILFNTSAAFDEILVYDAAGPGSADITPAQKLAVCWGEVKTQE